MALDAFDRLATTILRSAASRHTTRHVRFKVTKLDPLEARTPDGRIHVHEDDPDVEVTLAVTKARDDGDLDVGDVLSVKEDDDGYLIEGVIQ